MFELFCPALTKHSSVVFAVKEACSWTVRLLVSKPRETKGVCVCVKASPFTVCEMFPLWMKVIFVSFFFSAVDPFLLPLSLQKVICSVWKRNKKHILLDKMLEKVLTWFYEKIVVSSQVFLSQKHVLYIS